MTETSLAINLPPGKRKPYKGYHEDSHVRIRINYVTTHDVIRAVYSISVLLFIDGYTTGS
jgi:hypothetical protein